MATVGTINVGIRADTRKFDKAMRDARKRVKDFDKTTKTAQQTFRAFGAALLGTAGVVIGVRALTGSLRDAATRMDSLAKTSAKLGIASEQLAGLQHAANQTGVETNTLNMAIQRMVRRVAEAAQGTGEAKDAIKELGLSAAELNALAPDKAFAKIAEAMRQVDGQANKVRLAFKLFDSEGVALVNTLNLGASGLAKFNKEAQQLGLAIGEEDLKKVERLNDAMDKFQKVMQGTANELVITMAPAAAETLEGFTLAWRDYQDELKGGAGLAGGVSTVAGNMFGGIRDALGRGPLAQMMQNFGDRRRFTRSGKQRTSFGSRVNDDTESQIKAMLGDDYGRNLLARNKQRIATSIYLNDVAIRHEVAQQIAKDKDAFGVFSSQARSAGVRGIGRLGSRVASGGLSGGMDALGRGGNILEKAALKFDAFVKSHAKQAEDMLKRRADTAAALNAAFASPETVLGDELKRISEAVAFGLIGADVAGRARDAALEQFRGTPADTQQQNRLASLAEVGTIEGFRAMRRRQTDDPQQKSLEVQGKQLTQLEKLNEAIEKYSGGGVVVLGEGVG